MNFKGFIAIIFVFILLFIFKPNSIRENIFQDIKEASLQPDTLGKTLYFDDTDNFYQVRYDEIDNLVVVEVLPVDQSKIKYISAMNRYGKLVEYCLLFDFQQYCIDNEDMVMEVYDQHYSDLLKVWFLTLSESNESV